MRVAHDSILLIPLTIESAYSIHEDRPPMTEVETESSNGALDSASESDATEPEHHEWQSQIGETSEYSGKEPQQRENYYPITWRVIGGGVMMSGPRTCFGNHIDFTSLIV